MKHIHIFICLIFIMYSCSSQQKYRLTQQSNWEYEITKKKDSIFIRTICDKYNVVDTFYKGKDGYYATWSKKVYFATKDTLVKDTFWGVSPLYPIHKISKVTDERKDPILKQYNKELFKTEIVSYYQELYEPKVDLAPELINAYYYDKNFNIVGIITPYKVTFTK